jgi:hypothetical protein
MLYIERQVIDGKRAYLVREKHGWWDETERKPKHLVQTLALKKGFQRLTKRWSSMKAIIGHRVSNGFVHSLTHDFYSDDPNAFNAKS